MRRFARADKSDGNRDIVAGAERRTEASAAIKGRRPWEQEEPPGQGSASAGPEIRSGFPQTQPVCGHLRSQIRILKTTTGPIDTLQSLAPRPSCGPSRSRSMARRQADQGAGRPRPESSDRVSAWLACLSRSWGALFGLAFAANVAIAMFAWMLVDWLPK
jgi:hypothetical protein